MTDQTTSIVETGPTEGWCTPVASFGIKGQSTCECCPPVVMLALGMGGEVPTPLVLQLTPDMADEVAGLLQAAAHEVRGGLKS